jgi:hypothetical protein
MKWKQATMTKAKSIPKPPERRPTVAERISMLQMAQTHHGTYCPTGGVALVLPGLPQNAAETEPVDAVDELEPLVSVTTKSQRRPRYFPWKRSAAAGSKRKPEIIPVRLLDEREW